MRISCKNASDGYRDIMAYVKPGQTETELEGYWVYNSYLRGDANGRFHPYFPIFSYGPNTSILHHNAEEDVKSQGDEFVMIDAGKTFHWYCSDITRTFPVSGKFSEDQRWLYETVLCAQKTVMGMMKPGVLWSDCQDAALRVIGKRLMEKGILRTPPSRASTPLTIDEAMEKDLVAMFMNHGLGHMIGLDTHDVGGYARDGPARPTRLSFNRLRTNRYLEPGFILTVEPGCYFNPATFGPFFAEHPDLKEFYDIEQMEKVWYPIGGVRIEDNVLVTPTGIECLTSAPKEIDEIEAIMAEAKAKREAAASN